MHAGLDSPSAAVGRTDSDLIWRECLPQIQAGDALALSGVDVLNDPREIKTKNGQSKILLSKYAENDVIIGNAIDITGRILMEQNGRWDFKTGVFTVGNIELTKREVDVIRLLLLGQSVKIISISLSVHEKTIEQRVAIIRKKFNARNKSDLIRCLHVAGLGYLATEDRNSLQM